MHQTFNTILYKNVHFYALQLKKKMWDLPIEIMNFLLHLRITVPPPPLSLNAKGFFFLLMVCPVLANERERKKEAVCVVGVSVLAKFIIKMNKYWTVVLFLFGPSLLPPNFLEGIKTKYHSCSINSHFH